MRLDQIAAMTVSHLLGRLLRRAMAAVLMAIFVMIAVYHFTIAGTIELETQFGAVQARLIIGGVYTVFALISLAIFFALRAKGDNNVAAPALSQPREMQIAMLVEAVMLGYALARKGDRAH
jgi:type VI protein secretion system component VasK